jgi:D-sedoheptulose 7-phosphate isomerase
MEGGKPATFLSYTRHELTSPDFFALIQHMDFTAQYLQECGEVLKSLSTADIEAVVDGLAVTGRGGGRVFVLGVGGSAATASHFVNDLRKLGNIEAYAPTDNVSELTARTNDEGWSSCFEGWLKVSRLRKGDAVFVLSVGGGDEERHISQNLVQALNFAKKVGAIIVGVVGRDGGYTAKVADACVIIPVVNSEHVTPHTESFHSVVGHLLITHPKLKVAATKWESVVAKDKSKP